MELSKEQLEYLKIVLSEKITEHDDLAEFDELAICREINEKVEAELETNKLD